MAQCKWCGRSGESLHVTENGLCDTCGPGVVMDITNRARMINHCKKLVEESKELDTRLSNCDIIAENAEALLEYETRGIPTIRPLPSELIHTYRDGRDDLILKGVEREVENAVAAADILTSADTKVNQLSKMLLTIQGYKTKTGSPGLLDDLEKRLTNLIHQAQLNGYLEEARQAEVKGQRDQELDRYNDALHFLKRDDIDDSLRQENISVVEAKIDELGEGDENKPD